MPLVSLLPDTAGVPWSNSVPNQVLELVTTFHLDEKDALAQAPGSDIAWSYKGVKIVLSGGGVAKLPIVLPDSLELRPFTGQRHYNRFTAIAKSLKPVALDLNFEIPMIWDSIGNGYKLMSETQDGALTEFLGIPGVAAHYVAAGRVKRARMISELFYTSMYISGLLTSPTKRTFPQPKNPDGIALFTDGTGAEGSGGAMHYAHPAQEGSARFKNIFKAYGAFKTNYGRSLAEMAVVPHALWQGISTGGQVTETMGPTFMRTKFWEMAVQALMLESIESGGNLAAAGVTNPYALAAARGLTEENFIGARIGSRVFWINPLLDSHPWCEAHAGKDFWVNISAGKDALSGAPRPSWCQGAASNVEFTPTFRFYGAGDPLAQSQRKMRFEGDLDAIIEPGVPQEIQVFLEV